MILEYYSIYYSYITYYYYYIVLENHWIELQETVLLTTQNTAPSCAATTASNLREVVSSHRLDRGTGEPGDLAVRSKEIRGRKLIFASHNGHSHANLDGALEPSRIGLPQDPGHLGTESKELEIELQMGEAIFLGYLIIVDSRLLRGDGNNSGGDGEALGHLDGDAVGVLETADLEPGRSGRFPLSAPAGREDDRLVVQGKRELVAGVVPLCYLVGAQVELMGIELYTYGLHPGEIALKALLPALANEMPIDM